MISRSRPLAPSRGSAAFRRRLSVSIPALFDAGWRLAEHPQFRQIYPEYLILLHSMMRAAVPIMEDAIRQLEVAPNAEARLLVEYLQRHVLEEEGHDRWVLEDLERLGVARGDVLGRSPSPTIAGLVGAQYYWIRHDDPVALLGYIAVLEGYPPTVDAVEKLAGSADLPIEAFRTLREHAAVDRHHSVDLDRLMDEFALTDKQFRLICVNALMTVAALVQCVEEMLEDFEASACVTHSSV